MTANSRSALAATFGVLAEAETSRSEQLLVAALRVPRPAIQKAAAETLLKSTSSHGKMAVFRELDQLPDSVCELIHRSQSSLNTTFRQMLLQGNSESRQLALRVIRVTRQYHQMNHVLEVMNRPECDCTDDGATTVRSLVNSLYQQWRHEQHHPSDKLPSTETYRQSLLADLERATQDWSTLACPEDVVEGVLALSEPQHAVLKRVLWHGAEECRETAYRLLMQSRHPGVLRMMADSLSEQYPHPKIFTAIRTRHDPEFLSELLQSLSRRRSSRQVEHLHQVQQLDWLVPPFDVLHVVPRGLQPALMAFINGTRIPRELKGGVQEWLLRFGTPEGKRAATTGLTLLEDSVIQEVVLESLESEDVEIQAWATSQLRQLALPDAFSRLVERLDSPSREIQEAARAELNDFNVSRVLSIADDLAAEDARRAGVLLMKVDPDAQVKLRRELSHPARRRRIDAARRTARLGLQNQFMSAYVAMTHDSDPLVRRTAAQVLATISSLEAYRALLPLREDPHPRVRETATEALKKWTREANVAAGEARPEPELLAEW